MHNYFHTEDKGFENASIRAKQGLTGISSNFTAKSGAKVKSVAKQITTNL